MKTKKNKDKRKYWYLTEVDECVLCGRGSTYKTRQFTPKPTKPKDRYIYSQNACGCHF